MDRKQHSYQLTSYPVGSLREMWTVAWPLILGLLSGGLMLFTDRILLAKYSLDALTASANSSIAVFSFLIGPFTIAGISEVFVGQYHGNEDYRRVGSAAWQMLWFSVLLTPLFLCIAFFGPALLFQGTGNEALEIAYFTPLAAFGSVFCMIPALIGFFSGIGKVRIVFYANFAANILNIVLDTVLIFGWGPFPEMGISGAAWGTVIAQVAQAFFFFLFFFHSSNRKPYATTNWKWDRALFVRSIQIGFPAGIAHTSEVLAHLAFFRIMIKAGKPSFIIISIVQSLYFLIGFMSEGLSKAMMAVSSNLIGAYHHEKIGKVLRAAILLQLMFSSAVFFVILLGNHKIPFLFLGPEGQEWAQDPSFLRSLSFTIFWLGVFFLLDGLGWVFIGLLTAAGDTKFVMLVGFTTQWLFYFTPVYIGVSVFKITVVQAWMLICLNSFLIVLIYSWRYASGKWKEIVVRDSSGK